MTTARILPTRDRKHFIVKHGLDAFEALPNFIWRTGMSSRDAPHRFAQVKAGDRWIGFAYAPNDMGARSLSLVTGFYECTQEYSHVPIPKAGLSVSDGETNAWMIKGEPIGRQPRHHVGVPPIATLLGKRVWNNQAITPITSDQFTCIQKYALTHQFDVKTIPVLHREPLMEQELLAMVVHAHKKLGIEKILRVRTAFPDLLVTIKGCPLEVHLELELYSQSFFSHGHESRVHNRKFDDDNKPVAVLCWIDNDKNVQKYVHKVYELRSLIREKKIIRW